MSDSTHKDQGRTSEGAGIQVLSRAAEILRILRQDTTGLSLGKIAKRAELPRSTVQRIINALIAENMVTVGREAGGYVIGPEIVALAQAVRLDISRTLHPFLEELSRRTGETVDLAVFKDYRMVFVDQVVGSHRLRAVSSVNDSFPMTVTANGKAVCTLLTPELVSLILKQEQDEDVTKKSSREFFEELDSIRVQGVALDLNEHTMGISAVGIAFKFREAVYAVSIPAPSHRFQAGQDSFIEKLLVWSEEVKREIPDIAFPSHRRKAA